MVSGDTAPLATRAPRTSGEMESVCVWQRLQYGPYVLDRGQDVEPLLRYQPASRVLVVEGLAPLPDLQARAACLCSGRMPLRQYFAADVFEDHYVNVDPETAARIMTSLGMEAVHA